MCDPVTLTITAMTLAVASGGLKAYGQYEEGKAQDKYYQSLADQNEAQGELSVKAGEQKTTMLQNEAAARTKEIGAQLRETEGAQRAAMAASGTAGSVTAADVIGSTIDKAAIDEYNIKYNADIGSWAAKKEADETNWALRSQAGLLRYSGKQARKAAKIAMTSTLLGTAGSVAFMGSGLSGGGGGGTIIGGKGGVNTGMQPVGPGGSSAPTWSPFKA